MKKKIFCFNQSKLSQYPELKKLADQFDITENVKMSAEEVLQSGFDFIELAEGEFELFKPLMSTLEWKTSHIGVADLLFKKKDKYQPLNIAADCILKILKLNPRLDSAISNAMVIGSFDFVMSVASKMAMSGFSNLVISLSQYEQGMEIEKKLREFIFNLNIKFMSLNELTQLQTSSGVLISNLNEQMDVEAYESLAYFNFLSTGAVFVDFQSSQNIALIEEARRAELNVIEELEILTLKYQSLIEF